MDSLIGPVIDKVIDCTCGVVTHRLAEYSASLSDLNQKLNDLERERGTLQGRVDQAKQDGYVIKDQVQNFLSEAARISEQATTFLQTDCQTADVKCFVWSFPNLRSRRRLSKRAEEITGELSSHAAKALTGDGFHTITSRPALQSCIADRDGFEAFGTRERILEEVMAALSSDEVTKIGLYGMGGVGKTMLAKEVARQATEKNLFNEVVFVTLSQTPDLIAIQQSVAEKISLGFGGVQSKAERADRLKRRLKEEKRILVILDDIWNVLDLREVGLNLEPDQKGCKILMTSRNRNVTRSMGAEKNIPVHVLDSNEATTLFSTIVGEVTVEHSDFKSVAIDVVKECNGLPLALKAVASALKDKELDEWKNALYQLRNPATSNIDEVLQDVYPSIKLSFEYLRSEEAKKLLFLCSLYQEDWEIILDDLAMICVGWGLFQDVFSVGDARRRVRSMVGILKDRCLLLEGWNDERVKMHDVIRDVAIHIASGDKLDMHSFVIDEKLEDRLSKNKSIKDAKAISLHKHPASEKLPETSLNCPQLELFLMTFGLQTIRINDFLQECRNLKALFLVWADLVSVPSPIHSLQNLVTLRLQYCKLDDIDFIWDLRSLIILDLSGSTIRLLPSKIGQLNRLQVLNLEDCDSLGLIEENVISRLTELEELHIPRTFGNWGVREVGSEKRNANVDEWMNLQKLTSLSLRIPDAETLPKEFVFSQKLERYRLHIDCDEYLYWNLTQYSRGLVVHDCELRVFGSLIKRCEYLILRGLKNRVIHDKEDQEFHELIRVEVLECGRLKNLFPLSIIKRLHRIEVDDCKDMEEIVSVDDDAPQLPIQFQLRWLHLKNLPKFVGLFARPLSTGKALFTTRVAFPELSELHIDGCENVTYLLSISTGLTALYKLKVRNCRSLEVLFIVNGKPGGDEEEFSSSWQTLSFSKLRSLELKDLPNFKKFCATIDEDIMQFSKQETLFNNMVAFPELRDLKLCNINVEKIWTDDDQFPSSASNNCMQKLEVLQVDKFDNLYYVSSISAEPKSLQILAVRNCRSLEVILIVNSEQGADEEGTSSLETLSFPKLHDLELADLPNFKKFWAPVAEEITQLNKQDTLFNGSVAFPELRYLRLRNINVEKIWTDDDKFPSSASNNCMQKLWDLEVDKFDNLYYVSSISAQPKSLQTLAVRNCRSLEVILIVNSEQGADEEGTSSLETLSFPKLHDLELADLPNFKMFWAPVAEEITQLNKQDTLFNGSVAFPELRYLRLRNINVEKIWTDDDKFPSSASNNCMQKLWDLEVDKFDNLYYVSSISAQPKSLQTLAVRNCRSLEVILIVNSEQGADEEGTSSLETLSFPKLHDLELADLPNFKMFWAPVAEEITQLNKQDTLFNGSVAFPELRDLKLCNINVEKIWTDDDQFPSSASNNCMQKLEVLEVDKFDNLYYVSSISAQPKSLQILAVRNCRSLEVILIVNSEQGADEEGTSSLETLSFPELFQLELTDLPNFKKFWAPVDEEITQLNKQDTLFNGSVVLPRLQTLKLRKMNVKKLWAEDELRPTCHDNMNYLSLHVDECDNLNYLSSFSDERKNLYRLDIKNCRSLESIFVVNNKQGGDEQGTSSPTKLSFPDLRTLKLTDLPNLKKFWATINKETMIFKKGEAFFDETAFPALKKLTLSGLNNESLFPDFDHKLLPTSSVTNMEKLEKLEVSKCNKLKYLFSFAVAKSLVKLGTLQVSECNEMEGLVARKESDGHDWPDMFPKLTELRLLNLPTLERLCLGSEEQVRFQIPTKHEIVDCPKLKIVLFDKK